MGKARPTKKQSPVKISTSLFRSRSSRHSTGSVSAENESKTKKKVKRGSVAKASEEIPKGRKSSTTSSKTVSKESSSAKKSSARETRTPTTNKQTRGKSDTSAPGNKKAASNDAKNDSKKSAVKSNASGKGKGKEKAGATRDITGKRGSVSGGSSKSRKEGSPTPATKGSGRAPPAKVTRTSSQSSEKAKGSLSSVGKRRKSRGDSGTSMKMLDYSSSASESRSPMSPSSSTASSHSSSSRSTRSVVKSKKKLPIPGKRKVLVSKKKTTTMKKTVGKPTTKVLARAKSTINKKMRESKKKEEEVKPQRKKKIKLKTRPKKKRMASLNAKAILEASFSFEASESKKLVKGEAMSPTSAEDGEKRPESSNVACVSVSTGQASGGGIEQRRKEEGGNRVGGASGGHGSNKSTPKDRKRKLNEVKGSSGSKKSSPKAVSTSTSTSTSMDDESGRPMKKAGKCKGTGSANKSSSKPVKKMASTATSMSPTPNMWEGIKEEPIQLASYASVADVKCKQPFRASSDTMKQDSGTQICSKGVPDADFDNSSYLKAAGYQLHDKSSAPVASYGDTIYQPAGPLIEPHKESPGINHSSNSTSMGTMPIGMLPNSVRLPADLKVTYQTHPPPPSNNVVTSSNKSSSSSLSSSSLHKSEGKGGNGGGKQHVLHQPYKSVEKSSKGSSISSSSSSSRKSPMLHLHEYERLSSSSSAPLLSGSGGSSSGASASATTILSHHQVQLQHPLASSGLSATSHLSSSSSSVNSANNLSSLAAAAAAASAPPYNPSFGSRNSPFTPCKFPIVAPEGYRAQSPYPSSFLYSPATPQPSQNFYMTPFYTPPITPTTAVNVGMNSAAQRSIALGAQHHSASSTFYQQQQQHGVALPSSLTVPPPVNAHVASGPNYFLAHPQLQQSGLSGAAHHSIQPPPAPGHAGLFLHNQSSPVTCPFPIASCTPSNSIMLTCNTNNNSNNTNSSSKLPQLLPQPSISTAIMPGPEAGAKQPKNPSLIKPYSSPVALDLGKNCASNPSLPSCSTPNVGADPPQGIPTPSPPQTNARELKLESAKTFTEQYSLPDDITITPILIKSPVKEEGSLSVVTSCTKDLESTSPEDLSKDSAPGSNYLSSSNLLTTTSPSPVFNVVESSTKVTTYPFDSSTKTTMSSKSAMPSPSKLSSSTTTSLKSPAKKQSYRNEFETKWIRGASQNAVEVSEESKVMGTTSSYIPCNRTKPREKDIVHVIDPKSGKKTTIAKHISSKNLLKRASSSSCDNSNTGSKSTILDSTSAIVRVGKLNPDLDVILIKKDGNTTTNEKIIVTDNKIIPQVLCSKTNEPNVKRFDEQLEGVGRAEEVPTKTKPRRLSHPKKGGRGPGKKGCKKLLGSMDSEQPINMVKGEWNFGGHNKRTLLTCNDNNKTHPTVTASGDQNHSLYQEARGPAKKLKQGPLLSQVVNENSSSGGGGKKSLVTSPNRNLNFSLPSGISLTAGHVVPEPLCLNLSGKDEGKISNACNITKSTNISSVNLRCNTNNLNISDRVLNGTSSNNDNVIVNHIHDTNETWKSKTVLSKTSCSEGEGLVRRVEGRGRGGRKRGGFRGAVDGLQQKRMKCKDGKVDSTESETIESVVRKYSSEPESSSLFLNHASVRNALVNGDITISPVLESSQSKLDLKKSRLSSKTPYSGVGRGRGRGRGGFRSRGLSNGRMRCEQLKTGRGSKRQDRMIIRREPLEVEDEYDESLDGCEETATAARVRDPQFEKCLGGTFIGLQDAIAAANAVMCMPKGMIYYKSEDSGSNSAYKNGMRRGRGHVRRLRHRGVGRVLGRVGRYRGQKLMPRGRGSGSSGVHRDDATYMYCNSGENSGSIRNGEKVNTRLTASQTKMRARLRLRPRDNKQEQAGTNGAIDPANNRSRLLRRAALKKTSTTNPSPSTSTGSRGRGDNNGYSNLMRSNMRLSSSLIKEKLRTFGQDYSAQRNVVLRVPGTNLVFSNHHQLNGGSLSSTSQGSSMGSSSDSEVIDGVGVASRGRPGRGAKVSGSMTMNAMKKRAFLKPMSPGIIHNGMYLGKPRWSNGWRFEGEPYQAKVFVKNDDPPETRLCYPAMRHDAGEVIQKRDCVLMKSGHRKSDLPFVAKVAALWVNPLDGEMMFSLLWYYRPEHTDHGRMKEDMSDELFASKHRDSNSVATIEDRCYVLTFNEYCRYRKRLKELEQGLPDIPLLSVTGSPLKNENAVGGIAQAVWNGKLHSNGATSCPGKISPEVVFFCRRVYDYRQKRLLKNPS